MRYLSAVADKVSIHPGKVRRRDVPVVRVCTTHSDTKDFPLKSAGHNVKLSSLISRPGSHRMPLLFTEGMTGRGLTDMQSCKVDVRAGDIPHKVHTLVAAIDPAPRTHGG
jgi:hypothetical protein